ncbi:MAG: universal stress protein [Flavobacteriales bacterium]
MEPVFKNVIAVANDFSHESFTAIDHAAKFAQRDKDELLLIHVLDDKTKEKLEKGHKTAEFIRSVLEVHCAKIRNAYGIEARFTMPEGDIFTSIGEAVKSEKAKLLVMGTHGIQSVGERVLGSWALRIVDSSPVPVIIVQNKGPREEGYKKVLIELDNSDQCKRLLPYAEQFYKLYNSELVLFEDYEEDEFIAKEIALNKGFAEQWLKDRGVPYSIAIQRKGTTYFRDMAAYAGENNIDLIMLVAHKERGFVELISEPEQKVIYNRQEIPVLCMTAIQNHWMGNFIQEVQTWD